MSTTISTRTYESGEWVEREVEIRFPRRSYGGYRVVRADNGRDLGWVVKHDGLWNAYIASSAFRGADVNDTGDVLDEVPMYLFNGRSAVESNVTVKARTREEAADEIVYRLVREHAPAVGFGAHFAVKPYVRQYV